MSSARQPTDLCESPAVSIIVPARNEEESIEECLASLLAQRGATFELLVVDDGSTDRTRQIAMSLKTRVLDPDPLPAGWTGKSNALTKASHIARGKWLLFTDADTIHTPESLSSAVAEAEKNGAALLSYSPKQLISGFWQRALMPVVFAELATRYRPSEVSDPSSPTAAANGQYMLIRADVYRELGGHAAIAASLLEDVALAQMVKRSGHKIRFRMTDAVSTRMYRSLPAMWEGWTKNLALLFPRTLTLASLRMLEFLSLAAVLPLAAVNLFHARYGCGILWLCAFCALYFAFYRRIVKAHFEPVNNLLAFWGLPTFAILLLRSYIHYRLKGRVSWKNRTYYGLSDAQS